MTEIPEYIKLQNQIMTQFLELGQNPDKQKQKLLRKSLSKDLQKFRQLEKYMNLQKIEEMHKKFAQGVNNTERKFEEMQNSKRFHEQKKRKLEKQNQELRQRYEEMLEMRSQTLTIQQQILQQKNMQKIYGQLKDFEKQEKIQLQMASLTDFKDKTESFFKEKQESMNKTKASIDGFNQKIQNQKVQIHSLTREKNQLQKELADSVEKSLRTPSSRDSTIKKPTSSFQSTRKPFQIKGQKQRRVINSQVQNKISWKFYTILLIIIACEIVIGLKYDVF